MNLFKGRPIALALFIGAALLHLTIVLFNHYEFRTFAYYYGVYNFAFFDFAHFRSSSNTVLFDGSGATFLQDHFSLLLPLLSPWYWILKGITGTYTLLLFQWVAIVFGGYATYRLIELRTSRPWLPLCAMVCYFFMYSRFAAYVADCNLAIMGAALVPGFLYYFERARRPELITIFVLLLITREDFSLWLVFICLYLAIEHRRDAVKRKAALLYMLVSLIFFFVTMLIFIPALETANAKFMLFNYSALGQDTGAAIKFILLHPIEAIRLLFVNHLDDPSLNGLKLKYYMVFGVSGGLLLFFRPAMLLCFIPLVAKKMWNDDPIRWDIESYYGIETASILPALVFMVITGLSGRRLRWVAAMAVVLATLATTSYCLVTSSQWHAPSKMRFYTGAYWKEEVPVKEYLEALELIPRKASVSASGRFVSRLAFRDKIYFFPLVKDAEYVCAALSGEGWPLPADEYEAELGKLLNSKNWQTLYRQDNLIILRRTGEIDPDYRRSIP